MQVQWKWWTLPVLAGVLVALLAVGAGQALANTQAQMDVAVARVKAEAVVLQRQGRYKVKQGGKTVRVTPEARYYVWGTTDSDAEVTMRWRIRVRNKPEAGIAPWKVCYGRVTVRPVDPAAFDPNNAAALTAALATDRCAA